MSNEVKTFELKTVVCPLFASYPAVAELFPGLGRNKLNALVDAGLIRRKKTGDLPTDGVLYRVADILAYMESSDRAA
ncbi:MAG TPA: hypothetical protein PKI68_01100 [Pontiellaceae bacterium]|nr:hypothetical protein [Pontiellaceae bacterium]